VTLLEAKGLQVAYGGIRAVRGIDLVVREGELVSLIGANGAGKTTTLKALCGLLPLSAGTIVFRGESLARQPTHVIVRRGLVMVPEGRGVFNRLTVEENLHMGAFSRENKVDVDEDMNRVFELFPWLKDRRRQLAGTLSGGEQQMLAIGRGILARPRLLLLDEPSMGLAPLMVGKIYDTIRAIAQQGVTMLLVEQNARLALETSDRGYVMESGGVILEGASPELLDSRQVREAYLGE
jgi:branched-chain amino acid transport system ATP-binding protein